MTKPSRDQIEKTFLGARRDRESHRQLHSDSNIISADSANKTLWLPDSARLNKAYTAAVAERERGQSEKEVKARKLEIRRQAAADAEEKRWTAAQAQASAAEHRLQRYRCRSPFGDRPQNQASMPYNPITLQYTDTPAGRALLRSDASKLQRAGERMVQLHSRGNGAWNPITGAPNPRLVMPDRPSWAV